MSDLPVPDPNAELLTGALDIQHDTDPADDHGMARRIPHLGHVLLLAALMFFCSVVTSVITSFLLHGLTPAVMTQHPIAVTLNLMAAYAMTFAIAVPVFRILWRAPFFKGISWTWRAAKLHGWQLLLMGAALSIVAEIIDYAVKTPVESEISKLLKTPETFLLTALFGALIAPLVEEICFRGFLLPALATAYDWLALDRTQAGRDRWQQSTEHTPGALWFGAILSSVAFASIHGSQIHWASGALIVLFVVSLALSAVRIQLRSVAASTLVHVSYNSLIFLQLIIATGGLRHLDKI